MKYLSYLLLLVSLFGCSNEPDVIQNDCEYELEIKVPFDETNRDFAYTGQLIKLHYTDRLCVLDNVLKSILFNGKQAIFDFVYTYENYIEVKIPTDISGFVDITATFHDSDNITNIGRVYIYPGDGEFISRPSHNLDRSSMKTWTINGKLYLMRGNKHIGILNGLDNYQHFGDIFEFNPNNFSFEFKNFDSRYTITKPGEYSISNGYYFEFAHKDRIYYFTNICPDYSFISYNSINNTVNQENIPTGEIDLYSAFSYEGFKYNNLGYLFHQNNSGSEIIKFNDASNSFEKVCEIEPSLWNESFFEHNGFCYIIGASNSSFFYEVWKMDQSHNIEKVEVIRETSKPGTGATLRYLFKINNLAYFVESILIHPIEYENLSLEKRIRIFNLDKHEWYKADDIVLPNIMVSGGIGFENQNRGFIGFNSYNYVPSDEIWEFIPK